MVASDRFGRAGPEGSRIAASGLSQNCWLKLNIVEVRRGKGTPSFLRRVEGGPISHLSHGRSKIPGDAGRPIVRCWRQVMANEHQRRQRFGIERLAAELGIHRCSP
jgi:hypothetical protein